LTFHLIVMLTIPFAMLRRHGADTLPGVPRPFQAGLRLAIGR
jgi:hypothetical protein